MTTLIRHVRMVIDNARLASEQWKLIQVQRELEHTLREAHTAEMNLARLDHLRDKQELIVNWLISLERPDDDDIRHDLVQAERELADALARFEEHIL